MDYFCTIGSYISESGFEETLHQSGMCQPDDMCPFSLDRTAIVIGHYIKHLPK